MNGGGARSDKVELRWRRDLLSSSLQLEYDVARRAVGEGFAVTSDYSYARVVNGIEKEYSVDLLARKYFTTDDESVDDHEDSIARLDLLLECKYRRPGVSWLFIPQIKGSGFPRKPTLRTVLEFSNLTGVLRSPDIRTPGCYKGIEIDLAGRDRNRVTDEELRHGFEQLQYAIIPLLTQYIRDTASAIEYEDKTADLLFFAPILITTAPLFIAVENFDEIDLTKVTSIEDFATEVPILTIDMVIGAQFSDEVRRSFTSLPNSIEEQLVKLENVKKARGLADFSMFTYRSLKDALGYALRRLMSRIIVCNVNHTSALFRETDALVSKRITTATVVPLRADHTT